MKCDPARLMCSPQEMTARLFQRISIALRFYLSAYDKRLFDSRKDVYHMQRAVFALCNIKFLNIQKDHLTESVIVVANYQFDYYYY